MDNRNNIAFSNPLVMRVTRPAPCSYIRGMVEQRLASDISSRPECHDDLASAGFRRVENWVYRPICSHCQACQALRIPSGNTLKGNLMLSRGDKRILKKNSHITREILPNQATNEHFALFQKYLISRHGEGQMADMDFDSYATMVETSPIDTVLVEYRDGEDLFGVILVDLQKDGVSLVYSFFDPEKSAVSPGRFMILDCAAIAYQLGLTYVYLGYYIRDCNKMNYKAKFKQAEVFVYGSWQTLTETTPEPNYHVR